MKQFVVMAAGFVVVGCMAQASGSQLTRRAAFDLNCNEKELRYVAIDERTQGVAGCGKRATYVESCDGPRQNMNTTCTWVLNGTIESNGPTPAPASSGPPGATL